MFNMKKLKQNKFKGNKGITLIALVVTIVVLIILATISILAVFGDDGIISSAKKGKQAHEEGKVDENNGLVYYEEYLNNYSTGGSTVTDEDPTKDWDLSKVSVIDGGNGVKVPLPKEFYHIGGDISTGLVISDKQGDTLDASGTDMGNQFVWIPVDKNKFERADFDENGNVLTTTVSSGDKVPSGRSIVDCTEPYDGYSTEKEEYNTMRAQVLKYGGFYIGRFEAGVNSTTLREVQTTAQTVVCKKGVAPYNYVPWGKAMDDISEVEGESGAVYLAKNMYSSSKNVASTLIYGCQWDAMCKYIGDAQTTETKKSEPELTGSVNTDVHKNIYDLAGNCYEWTMEVYSNADTAYRVVRGGSYNYVKEIYMRGNNTVDRNKAFNSFRPALYIK